MHTIAPYRLVISDSLRPKNKRFCELANIRGLKFHKLFKEFMEAHENDYSYSMNDGHKHAFKISDCTVEEGRIFGFIETGGSGKKGKIIDTDNSKSITTYGSKHANTTRKFFLIMYEKDSYQAFLYMHQISGDGAKTQLTSQLNCFIKQKHQALTPQIQTLTFESALKTWKKQAVVNEIRGYHVKEMKDSSDMFNGLKENHKIEIICKPPGRGLNFGSLELFSNEKDVKKLVAFEDQEPTEVKVQVNMNGKSKIMSLFSKKLPICTIDFDDRSVDFDDGEPKIDSILNFCLELER